jgi:hypothetical protein
LLQNGISIIKASGSDALTKLGVREFGFIWIVSLQIAVCHFPGLFAQPDLPHFNMTRGPIFLGWDPAGHTANNRAVRQPFSLSLKMTP